MKPIPVALALVGGAALCVADADASAVTIARLAVAGATLGAAAATDLAEHRIPNRLVLPAAVACAALSIVAGISTPALIGLAAIALLLTVGLLAPNALGMGDIKLMLVIALGLGQSALKALLLGLVLAGLVAAAILATQGRQAGKKSLPLAPFLALGSLIALL